MLETLFRYRFISHRTQESDFNCLTTMADQISAPAANGTPNVESDMGTGDGPSSLVGVGPPSPLTGCYLLIIIGEPHSQGHQDVILQRVLKGNLQIKSNFKIHIVVRN